jgi:hypothetical protein
MIIPFDFERRPSRNENGDSAVFIIPAGILRLADLLAELKRLLVFPEYFGQNLNALFDMLMDLGWITKRRVVLVHKDLPMDGPGGDGDVWLREYLLVLRDAVIRHMRPESRHKLVVVFPFDVAKKIHQLLAPKTT